METDYAAYDSAYQKRLAQGQAGWDDAETIAENDAILAQVFAAPHFPKQGRLLEMGCGAGDMSLGLAALGYDVSGVDIAPSAVGWARDKARERGRSADFQVGSVLDLSDYADESFDLVLDGHCLHCIIGEDRARFLAAALRVLKLGGLLHVNTMTGERFSRRFPEQYDADTRCQVINGIAYRYFGRPEDVSTEVALAGFEIVKSTVVPGPSDNDEDMLLVDARKPSK